MPEKKAPMALYREGLHFVGLLLVGLGTVLMAKSNLGTSVASSITYVLWQIWPQLSWGTWTYGLQTLLILMLVVFLRRFKLAYAVSYAVALAFSIVIDLFNRLLAVWTVDGLLLRSLCFGSGLMVLQFGVAMMVFSSLPLMPLDLFVRELAEALGKPFGRVKWVNDLSYIAIATMLIVFVLRKWVGIGPGTLLAAAVNGPVIGFWIRLMQSRVVLKRLWG